MNTNIFQPYNDLINNALKSGKRRQQFYKANETRNFSGYMNDVGSTSAQQKPIWFDEEKDMKLFNSLQPLSAISGATAKYGQKLGNHPDFTHIKTHNTTENHYIVSVFIDIKKSTELFKKYYPDTVANITTTLQKVAIHTCWYFDGYIQRLHGDGLLIFFGGKNIDMKTANNSALNASAVFSYFVKNDLKNIFNEQGIKNIYTRIGIDTGQAEDVFWHLAGVGECSEITTCSLHTSLAYKMQTNATSNGVIIGDNVRDYCSVSSSRFTHKNYQGEDGEEQYIFEIPDEKFCYSQYEFDWHSHLKSMPSIVEVDGKLYFTGDIKKTNENVSKLLNAAQLINTGKAYTDSKANIGSTATEIKNQDHRFHLE